MELEKILSIAGKPGLYQVLSQSRGGVIAKSLIDGKKISIGQTQRVSTLSDISVYTEDGDEPLKTILKSFFEHADGKELTVDIKDDNSLRDFFTEILPEHDEDRVYASDIKKMIKWYNLLLKNNLLDFDEVEEQTQADSEATSVDSEKKQTKKEKGEKSAEAKTEKEAKPAAKKKSPKGEKADLKTPKKPSSKKGDS